MIDNTDQTAQNGVLFADARWADDGSTDPITGEIDTIKTLLTSDYVDLRQARSYTLSRRNVSCGTQDVVDLM